MLKQRFKELKLDIGKDYMVEYTYQIGFRPINRFIGKLVTIEEDALFFEHGKRIYFKKIKIITGKRK